MPALISYITKRGIIYYTPPNSPNAEPEAARFPSPPCRPRARRPYSIQIARLSNISDSSPRKRQSKPFDLKSIFSFKTPKRLLVSALVSLTPKASGESHRTRTLNSEDLERPESYSIPAVRQITTGLFKEESHARRKRRSKGLSIMSRSSIGGNSWRPVFNTEAPNSGNTMSSSNPPSGMFGNSRTLNPQQYMNEEEKPLVSGNEVSCSILLAEPVIYLMGLDHDGTIRDTNGANVALLRGTLRLKVTKNAKLKAVNLKFSGKAKTLWPEGIPPQKQDTAEECSLRTQVIPFFNVLYKGSESSYGDLCNYTLRDSKSTIPSLSNQASESPKQSQQGNFLLSGITNRAGKHNIVSPVSEGRKISVPSIQLKIQQKSDSTLSSFQTKGYKVFYPGVYDYSFELPIDSNLPETTNLPLASVKWELEATIERAGAFKTKLVGRKEVPVVRSPSQDSLELVEPIAVSRTWDQQLHYDIVISGKSFPIGTKIPIAFKLTPLAKVQVHKVKVFLSENVEYFARDRSVHRKDVKRKLLLLEKTAGKPISKEFWPSEVKILGGEGTVEEREMRRSVATRRREAEAERNNTSPVPLPECSENLLGDIDLGMEEWWGQTEIEMNVQIPTCETMEKDHTKRLSHDCTWSNVNVNHWLKVRATLANISLPEYSGLNLETQGTQQTCGCQSSVKTNQISASLNSFNGISSMAHQSSPNLFSPGPSRPTFSNLPLNMVATAQRPIHLMRSPSFQPPPFDAEEPPPPIISPPPLYDNVIGTPSYDGLADYFARLDIQDSQLIHPTSMKMDTNNISRLNLSMTVTYSSLKEATEAEKSYAKANGYCLNIRRTQMIGNKAGGMVKHRILQCVHSGKPTSQANVRSTCTLRQDCPFLLRISRDDESGNTWSADIINVEHNHEAVDNIAAYPSARCLAEAEVETVHKLSSIGAKPRIVIGALNQKNSSNLSTRQDIYNINKLKKRKLLDGRSEIEALLDILLTQDVQHAYRRDQDGNLTCLLINPKRAETIMKNLSANKSNYFQRTHNLIEYSQLSWRDVKKSISRYALKLVRTEYHKSLVPEDLQCSNIFTSTMGIPCSHRLRRMLADPTYILSIHDFDQHWWLNRRESSPLIQPDEVLDARSVLLRIEERLGNILPHQQQLLLRSLVNFARQDLEVRNPLTAQTRGRPTGSTRRNPSAFEYAQQTQQQTIQPQRIRSCGMCNTIGHNSRTCPLRDDAAVSTAQQISAPPFGQ
ncbi:unnamed protein product [Trifolium pratense]|uniref:Uncharacterized protein n=1 Tax=Trifolium pratense TaxID=57577 RepID=A0ACB0K769_TRIPR|nr:unnamed protein product [Trifolium pratense]